MTEHEDVFFVHNRLCQLLAETNLFSWIVIYVTFRMTLTTSCAVARLRRGFGGRSNTCSFCLRVLNSSIFNMAKGF